MSDFLNTMRKIMFTIKKGLSWLEWDTIPSSIQNEFPFKTERRPGHTTVSVFALCLLYKNE